MYDELVEQTHSNVGGFCRHYMTLYSIILGMESKNVFEFGSGFSSKAILMALEKTGGKLTSCDRRPLNQTGTFYKKDDEVMRKLCERWNYLQTDSKNLAGKLNGQVFDVVLHDGSHDWRHVLDDIKFIVPMMKKGGMLLVHDTAHPTENFNLLQSIDDSGFDFDYVTLPYGYGLTIAELKEDFGNGEVIINWRKGQ